MSPVTKSGSGITMVRGFEPKLMIFWCHLHLKIISCYILSTEIFLFSKLNVFFSRNAIFRCHIWFYLFLSEQFFYFSGCGPMLFYVLTWRLSQETLHQSTFRVVKPLPHFTPFLASHLFQFALKTDSLTLLCSEMEMQSCLNHIFLFSSISIILSSVTFRKMVIFLFLIFFYPVYFVRLHFDSENANIHTTSPLISPLPSLLSLPCSC